MPFFSQLMAKYYDRALQNAETKCLQEWRAVLLSHAFGDVLEIGCGTGLNLDYYPDSIKHLYLAEPDAAMREKLQLKISTKKQKNIDVLSCPAESIPLLNASCDTVISTLVLCTVKNLEKSLSELHRILKPNGKLIFIEHVAAHNNPQRLRWQYRLEPFWKIIACGCCLTRQTQEAIINAGFQFEEISRQSMRGVPAIVRPSIKGIAIKT